MNALFYSVLNASFHGSIVIAAVLLLRLLLRKAPKKYLCYLWLLAGLRLLMPFEIQSELSLQPQSVPETMIRWEQPAPMRVELENSQNLPGQADLTFPDSDPAQSQAASPEEASPETAPVKSTFSPASLIPFLWIGVAAAFLIYSACGYVNLKKKVRRAVKIPGGWESDGIETAFILGFVRPQIYIPVGMVPETRKHILAHERTHLDKGDHWIKMIGFLALALHWFNPLVWLAYILLCKDIEMACDERVVQFMELSERKEYSTALLNCSTNRIHYAASPVAFGEVSVKSRIQSILNYRKPGFWVGLLSVIAIAFVTVCLVTSPTKPAGGGTTSTVSSAKFAPATQPPMEENPDWGLSVLAEAQSPTMVRLYYGVNVEDIPWDGTPIYIPQPYEIEAWNGKSWEALPIKVQVPRYEGSTSVELGEEYSRYGGYSYVDLDLSTIYGSLSEGDYRVVIRPQRLGETRPFCAWFHIYTNVLTGDEAEAVAKCETALADLPNRYGYSATISESTEQGSLLPIVTILKDGNLGRLDSYYGEFRYGTYNCSDTDTAMTSWLDNFLPMGNKHLSFPKGTGKIGQDEITFQAAWADMDGKEFRQDYTYRFDESGGLTAVDQLTRSTQDGVTVQSQRNLEISKIGWNILSQEDLTPKDSYDSQLDSPWNILFRVDDDLLKSSAGDVWMGLSADVIGVSPYTTDSSYWLERKVDGKWQKLPSKAGDPSWGTETYRLKSRTISIDQIDWTPYYGQLDSGLYRMGKYFYKGDESIIQFAEFYIPPRGGISGEGGEEAIARIRAAMDKINSGNYCITEEYYGGFRQGPRHNNTYWKYGDACVTDYYNVWEEGYSHSSLILPDDRNADLFYNQWTQTFTYWDNESYQLLFPQGISVISDREITFAGAYANSGGYSSLPFFDNLNHYSFFFDESGNLTRIQYSYGIDDSSGYFVLTVQPKSDAEIREWVEHIEATSQDA